MSLWGASSTNQQEPKYLANVSTPWGELFQNYGHVYADNSGWQMVNPSNTLTTKTETLVAIGGLADTLGAPQIVNGYFRYPTTANAVPVTSADANTSLYFSLAFNQQVSLLTGTPPTFNVTQTGAISSNVTATYVSGNNTSILNFSVTLPNDFAGNTTGNSVLTVPGQPIAISTVLRAKTNINTNANTYIPTSANLNYPFTNRAMSVSVAHPVVSIANISFASGSSLARNTASNVFVNFTGPVKVLTTAVPVLTLNVATGNTTNATYASGNGTSNLRFTWTGPQFTANVVSIWANRTFQTFSINDTANVAANVYVTSAVANAAGTVTPI